jgi:hypothetical protein
VDGDYVNKLDVDDYCHGPSDEAGLSIAMTYQCLSADNIELDDRIGPSLSHNCKAMMQHFGTAQPLTAFHLLALIAISMSFKVSSFPFSLPSCMHRNK